MRQQRIGWKVIVRSSRSYCEFTRLFDRSSDTRLVRNDNILVAGVLRSPPNRVFMPVPVVSFRMETVTHYGRETAYEVVDRGSDGPPICCIHGAAGLTTSGTDSGRSRITHRSSRSTSAATVSRMTSMPARGTRRCRPTPTTCWPSSRRPTRRSSSETPSAVPSSSTSCSSASSIPRRPS